MKKLLSHSGHTFASAFLGFFLLISASAKSQGVERFKIKNDDAKSMRNANTINTKAVNFSVADLKAILAQAATDEVQFQFVRKGSMISVIVAIKVNNPDPEPEPGPTPGKGPAANMAKKTRIPGTSATFFDAGTFCPPPADCIIQ